MTRSLRAFSVICAVALGCACEETTREAPKTTKPTPAATATPSAPKRYGDIMAEVGRRFERAGHAVVAGRWELAGYDIGEIGELFEDDIPIAIPPGEVKVDLRSIAQAFTNTHPAELKRTIAARDRTAFDAAFARASVTCNACHQSAGKLFIEVPSVVGTSVPKLTPLAASASPPPPKPDLPQGP